jgi:hypothetical protein
LLTLKHTYDQPGPAPGFSFSFIVRDQLQIFRAQGLSSKI